MKKTFVLSLVMITAMHFSSPIALALPTNGLVAWWQGEGNANDAVGANHGTLVGNVTFAPGKVGQAFRLNGVNAYVDLGTAVDVPSWPNYAVSLWFQNDGGGSVAGGPGQKIIDKTVFFHDFWIVVHTHSDAPPTPPGSVIFFTYEGGAGDQPSDYSHDYRDNTWHHVVINKSGSNGEMWLDGTLVEAMNNVRTVFSDGSLVLGYSLSPDSIQRQYFSGLIDDVGIYNRPLTAAEIADISGGSLLPTVTIVAADPRSGEHGPSSGRFRVCRTGSTNELLRVHYSVGGTATAGVDYRALRGRVTILPGRPCERIRVTPIDDVEDEPLETVEVTLLPDPAYHIGSSSNAVVNIRDND